MKHYSNLGEYSWSSAVILKPGVVTLLFVTEILQCVAKVLLILFHKNEAY